MSNGIELRTLIAAGMTAGLILLAGTVPSPLSAQDMDSRWLPWLGCWEAAEAGEEVPLICVRPAAEGSGVEFVSWFEGEGTASETILADGVPRNAEREDCQGMEEARFSADGRRIFLKSEYVCDGGVERRASGILAMVNPMEWVDIKAVDGSPWVLRYRLARASRVQEAGLENVVASRATAVKGARIAASAPLTEDNIIEAAQRAEGAAVEALIVEKGDAFAVDADMLIRLDDAQVPAGVIDLVVAISHPERFAVKSGAVPVQEYADDTMTPRRQMYMGVGFYDPFYSGRYGYSPFYYGAYGYGGYGGYGYGYGGYGGYGYGYGYGYRPAPIVVTPVPTGSMIRGQGATRGGAGSGYTGRTARPRGGSASSGGSRSPSSPAVRSGGSSSGRTAKPRGGGSVSSSSGRSSSSGSSAARTAVRRTGGGGI